MLSIKTAHETTHALAQEVLSLIPDTSPADPQYEKVLQDAQTQHEKLREQAGNFLQMYIITGTRGLGKMATAISSEDAALLVHWVDNLIGMNMRAQYHEQRVADLPVGARAKLFHAGAAKILVESRDFLKIRLKRLFEAFSFLKPDQPSQPGQIDRLKDSMTAVYKKVEQGRSADVISVTELGMRGFRAVFGIEK